MTVRKVLTYPNKVLCEVSQPVEDFESNEFKQLCEDLSDTLHVQRAHGLAAIQIGVPSRVFIIAGDQGIQFFVNPKYIETKGTIKWREGCLSFPGVEEQIERHEEVTLKARDETGREFTVCVDALEAVAVQHEHDHLDGILFIDKVSNLKKRFMVKKLKKLQKKYGRTHAKTPRKHGW